jgi:hypothetical protein
MDTNYGEEEVVDLILSHNEIRPNERSEWCPSLTSHLRVNMRPSFLSALVVRFFNLNRINYSRRMTQIFCSLLILVIALIFSYLIII